MSLILTRQIGQSIMVGDDVVITVLAVNGNQVRIGIAAPKHIEVHREEIYARIQAEKKITPAKNTDDKKGFIVTALKMIAS